WIRELWGKYRLLDVKRVVAVAGHGFSTDALLEAKCLGITALTIEEAASLDWTSRIRHLAKLVVSDVRYEHIGTSVELAGTGPMPAGFATEVSAIQIALPRRTGFKHLGDNVVTLRQFIDRILSEPCVDHLLARNSESHPNKEGWLGAKLAPGTGIFDISGRRFTLLDLRLRFRRAATDTEVLLSQGSYDGAAIAVGSAGENGAVNVAMVHVQDTEITGKLPMLVDGGEHVYELSDMTRGLIE